MSKLVDQIVDKVFSEENSGYNKKEVDDFLDSICDEIERLEIQNRKLIKSLNTITNKSELADTMIKPTTKNTEYNQTTNKDVFTKLKESLGITANKSKLPDTMIKPTTKETENDQTINEDIFTIVSYRDGYLIEKYIGFDDRVIIIPSSIKGKRVIGLSEGAFENAGAITSVTLSAGIESIGSKCFYQCKNLTTVVVPNTVQTIDDCAFAKTSIKSMDLPDSVIFIGNSVFSNTPLMNVKISNSLRFIPANAFNSCVQLRSIIVPEGVAIIDYGAFYNCSQLKSVDLPNSLVSIEECAFCNCTSLTKVDIPPSVTTIKEKAFSRSYIVQPDRRYNPWTAYENLNIVIACKAGSAAQEYARKNEFLMEKSNSVYKSTVKSNYPIYIIKNQFNNQFFKERFENGIKTLIKENKSHIVSWHRIDESQYCFIVDNDRNEFKKNVFGTSSVYISRY